MNKFRIAVVQFKINQYNPDKNLEKMEYFLKLASGKADIIVFPENFLTGGLSDKEILVDCKEFYSNKFQNLTKLYKIDIVPGSIVEGNKKGKFNTSYYIRSDGRILAKYNKVNLWLTEKKYLASGNEICVFNTKFGKFGILICWDLMFPEIFRRLIKKGVKLVFCPSLWYKGSDFYPYKINNPNAELDHINALCQARAIENNIFLVFSNNVGRLKTSKNKFDEAIGQSQICAPIKGVIKKLALEEEMFIEEIDLDLLKSAEKAYQIRKNINNTIL